MDRTIYPYFFVNDKVQLFVCFPRFLMADRRGTTTEKIQYYGSFPGSGVHISLNPVGMAPCSGNCIKDYVMDWVDNFSNKKWPNWMVLYYFYQIYITLMTFLYFYIKFDIEKALVYL